MEGQDAGDGGMEFAGAVGFFDAPESAPRPRRARSVAESGAMGFFDVLDSVSEKALGLRQAAFVHHGPTLGRDELSQALMANAATLTRLVLRDCAFTTADLEVLSGSLFRLSRVSILDFSGNRLGAKGLAALLDCCRGNVGLSELYLSSIGLENASYECVCRALDEFAWLQVLDLSSNGLSPEVIRAVGLAASEHPFLQTLRLEKNHVSLSSAAGVLRCLAGNTVMHTLILGEEAVRAATMKNVIKRSLRHDKDALSDALVANVSLHSLQVDGMSAHDTTRARSILEQNEKIAAVRAGGPVVRLELSQRGLTAVNSVIFSLTHITELDLSANGLATVPEAVLALKMLSWLSIEDNAIQITALPYHLCSMHTLRHLLVRGNPFVASLPKHVAFDSCTSLLEWFGSASKLEDLECQVAVLCATLDATTDETASVMKELERRNRLARKGSASSGRAVRMQALDLALHADGLLFSKFGGAVASPKRTRRLSLSGSKHSLDQITRRASKVIPLDTNRQSGAEETQQTTVWGALRECGLRELAVLVPFHPVLVVSLSVKGADWEARLREAFGALGSSGAQVLLALTNTSHLTVEARKGSQCP
jgi:Leucine-rich repeat (LRR) protein